MEKLPILFTMISIVAAFTGIIVFFILAPPKIEIKAVISEVNAFESKLEVKNTGYFAAKNIRFDVPDPNSQFIFGSGLQINGYQSIGSGCPISKLAHKESFNQPIIPPSALSVSENIASTLTKCSYILEVKWGSFYNNQYSKKWKVELRNYETGHQWNCIPL